MLAGVLAGLLAGAFWGLSFIIPKLLPDYSASDIMLGRFGLSAIMSVIILFFLGKHTNSTLTRVHFWKAVYLSIFGGSLYYYLLVYAIANVGVVVSTIIIGLLPITISLAGHKAIVDRKMYTVSIIGIMAGLVALNIDLFGKVATDVNRDAPTALLGLLLVFGALISWTYFNNKNGEYLRHHSAIDLTAWSCLVNIGAGITSIIFAFVDYFVFHKSTMILNAMVDARFIFWCTLVALTGSLVAFVLWSFASRRLPSGLAGQLLVSETVFGLLYGFLYEWRAPHVLEGIAIALLLAGVLCGVRAFRQKT